MRHTWSNLLHRLNIFPESTFIDTFALNLRWNRTVTLSIHWVTGENYPPDFRDEVSIKQFGFIITSMVRHAYYHPREVKMFFSLGDNPVDRHTKTT